MTAQTLTDFLLARIAEDEAVVGRLHDLGCTDLGRLTFYGWPAGEMVACNCGRPSRGLTEVRAKRRLVKYCSQAILPADANLCGYDPEAHVSDFANGVLEDLALPYADHPDYRAEWRA